MTIGLPQIRIDFKEAIRRTTLKAGLGIVAIILKDTQSTGVHEIFDLDDIPKQLNETNKTYLSYVLEGFGAKPSKVIAYVLNTEESEDIQLALDYFEGTEFNIMTAPYEDNEGLVKVEAYINKLCNLGVEVFGVLGAKTQKPTTENIIYVTFEDAKIGEKTLTSNELAVIVTGMIAGCPNPLSLTYATVPLITEIPKLTKDTLNTRIGNGEIVLFKEAGEIRIARGVTSFTQNTEGKGYAYKKIKTVSTIKQIKNDIRLNLVKNYIGKVQNSYENKLLLIGVISEYLRELSELQLIEANFDVQINLEAQKKYLKETLGQAVNDMTDQEILEANTKDQVFISIFLKLLDSIENVDIVVNI